MYIHICIFGGRKKVNARDENIYLRCSLLMLMLKKMNEENVNVNCKMYIIHSDSAYEHGVMWCGVIRFW